MIFVYNSLIKIAVISFIIFVSGCATGGNIGGNGNAGGGEIHIGDKRDPQDKKIIDALLANQKVKEPNLDPKTDEHDPSPIKIELTKPNREQLKTFEEKILIEGKIIAQDKKNISNLMRGKDIVLLPVIEGNQYYTYDHIPINADGSFQYSWPISSDHIKGRRFWVGIFEINGIIQPRNRYNKSPTEEAKYISKFIYFE